MPSAPSSGSAASSLVGEDRVSRDAAPDVPTWAMVIGALLVLLFIGLSANAYFGGGLLDRLRALRPAREALPAASGLRAFYSPIETASVGMPGIGSRGQDRLLQAGDLVLLGASGRLVRLEASGVTELAAGDGATVVVQNLGAWDEAAGRLAGQTARFVDGRWVVDTPPAGSIFSLNGRRDEDLPAGFALVPAPSAGRARRQEDGDGLSVRIRAAENQPFVGLETRAPIDAPDGALVTVWAQVRARDDTTIGLTLDDVVDAAGAQEQASGRWSAPKGWTRVTLHRRVKFQSPNDRLAVGLVDARVGDWLDVRDAGVFVGALP